MRIVLDLQACQTESRYRGIGRYSMALALAMARHAGEHELWLTLNCRFEESILDIRAAFDGLIPVERIRVFDIPGPVAEANPNNVWRARAAERIREHSLACLHPDVVHISSLFEGWVDNASTSVGLLGDGQRVAVTLYDLIPLLNPDTYLHDPRFRDYYFRKTQSLKNAGILLAISEYSRREAVDALNLPTDRIATISAAIDSQFRPCQLSPAEQTLYRQRYGLSRNIILYVPGGCDQRKNFERLIEAYAILPCGLRQNHQLVIASRIGDIGRDRLTKHANRVGLSQDELILTDYVPDKDLVLLYNLATLFVFPSLHEGFGLPVLEAMACGAPTLGANLTSIPEVIGREDALFDPYQPQAIANKMAQALQDEAFRHNLCQYGLQQAKQFSWDTSAKRALAAFESLHERLTVSAATRCHILRDRPRLACVSPVPPEKTGIADYCAELLPELARHYDIDIISDLPEVSNRWLSANFSLRGIAWFEANAHHYDRVLYQFGNSPFHAHMVGLLDRHPGTVVLHDFFLNNIPDYLEKASLQPRAFRQALYDSHGYTALIKEKEQGREAAKYAYPCNLSVIRNANGIIVHSWFSQHLAEQFYDANTASDWVQIPFLRVVRPGQDRIEARNKLGLEDADFLVCSFGQVDSTKLNHRLLDAWLNSALAKDEQCRLVFVGENQGGEYGRSLLATIKSSAACSRINITGFVEPDLYRAYLYATDAAVQLRTLSRGETSAAIFDCITHGVPLIFNAHGTATEIPDNVGIKLDDVFDDKSLINALEQLHADTSLRSQLAVNAITHIKQVHAPACIGEQYRDAIELFARDGPRSRYQSLLASLRSISLSIRPTEQDQIQVARSIAANRFPAGQRRFFIDVSEIAKHDLRTGIERVTRSLLFELLTNPPNDYRVEPIYRTEAGFRHARSFVSKLIELGESVGNDEVIDFNQGDIYLAAEWSPPGVEVMGQCLQSMRARGVHIYFLVFDILPIQFPDYFPDYIEPIARQWLKSIAEIADGLVCISRTVADQVFEWLEQNPPRRQEPLNMGYFHLGADIHSSYPTTGLPDNSAQVLQRLANHLSFLMIGTLEPRKGHAQTLAAFEQLWADGMDINLVIVGKQGWKVEGVCERLRNHPEQGKRLIWLENVSDEYLHTIYEASTALVAASEGEGFGLPLVEASRHKLPIIARDIAVFREVAGEYAFYFTGQEPSVLRASIKLWMELQINNRNPSSENMPQLTWTSSVKQLLSNLLGSSWYRLWVPPSMRSRAVEQHLNYIHQARLRMVRELLPPGKLILDLGGANSPLYQMGYPHRFERLTMIDLPQDERHEYYKKIIVDPTSELGEVFIHYSDMTKLDTFEDKSIDFIWSGQSIEHVPPEAGSRMCEEVFRVLKHGGSFCLDTPNRFLTKIHTKDIGGGFIHPEHCIEYYPDQLRELLVTSGFLIEQALGICEMPETTKTGQFHYEDFMFGHQISTQQENCYIQYFHCIKP